MPTIDEARGNPMTDSKELKERLASWPASLGKGDSLSTGFVASLMGEAGAHIAALEARVEVLEGALRKARGFVDAWPKGMPIKYQREVLAVIEAALGGKDGG